MNHKYPVHNIYVVLIFSTNLNNIINHTGNNYMKIIVLFELFITENSNLNDLWEKTFLGHNIIFSDLRVLIISRFLITFSSRSTQTTISSLRILQNAIWHCIQVILYRVFLKFLKNCKKRKSILRFMTFRQSPTSDILWTYCTILGILFAAEKFDLRKSQFIVSSLRIETSLSCYRSLRLLLVTGILRIQCIFFPI